MLFLTALATTIVSEFALFAYQSFVESCYANRHKQSELRWCTNITLFLH